MSIILDSQNAKIAVGGPVVGTSPDGMIEITDASGTKIKVRKEDLDKIAQAGNTLTSINEAPQIPDGQTLICG
tara:strand:- start:4359 stop:4577 length:219 start_codon:yes stop_codon:yes gene_type:complete